MNCGRDAGYGTEKVTICGSMRFLDKMKSWKQKLESQGYEVFIPTPFDFHTVRDEEKDLERFEEIKRRETKHHFQRVELADVLIVLNYDKDGKKNYVGGNTFAEISYAVALNLCHGRSIRIYTINPLPEDSWCYEELHAWGIMQWHG